MSQRILYDFISTSGAVVIEKGRFKGRSLSTLSNDEGEALLQAKTRGKNAEFGRHYVRSLVALEQLVAADDGDESVAPLPAAPVPEACQVVQYRAKPRPATKNETGKSLADLVASVIWSLVPSWKGSVFPTFHVLQFVAYWFICALMYTPLAKLPAKAMGVCVRCVGNRFADIWVHIFEGFQEELGSLFNSWWSIVDSAVTGATGDVYPAGKAAIYLTLGACLSRVLTMPLIH